VNASIVLGYTEATGGLRSAPGVSVIPDVPNDVRSTHPALFLVIQTPLFPSMMHPTVPVLRWDRSRSQSVDQPQDFLDNSLGTAPRLQTVCWVRRTIQTDTRGPDRDGDRALNWSRQLLAEGFLWVLA
jgi:hypothetical protein